MFGAQRLREVIASSMNELSLQKQIEVLRDSVRQFESGYPPVDDLTLMLARWTGRPLGG
jgi:serine phosphatase RsbU (regulator of sigma subunit)